MSAGAMDTLRSPGDEPAGVLVLDPTGGDHAAVRCAAAALECPCATVRSVEQALGAMARTPAAVLLARCPEDAAAAAALLQTLRRRTPLLPVILFGDVEDPALVVSALRQGAADFVARDLAQANLESLLGTYLQRRNDAPVSCSDASRSSFELALRVARTDVSVLITGESGTGKEVVARFIHQRSNRAEAPFVAVNCAAIPEQMMEATLFGHEKGAFTGAHQSRPGKFEICHGGTLLLDEISEMSLDLQAKLLRVLQEREVERIGAHECRAVDVRVLATSNRDLRAEVAAGRFREDLFYRLSVFPLQLQPLRERVDDILPLAEWFVGKHAPRMGRGELRLSRASREVLVRHPWVGNVRELENVIQRALVMVEGDIVEPVHLGIEAPAGTAPVAGGVDLGARVRDAEETVIAQTLASCNGRRKEAARALGISERTLRYKLQKLRERSEAGGEGLGGEMAP